MILKIIIGKGFRGVLDYVSQVSKTLSITHKNDRLPNLHQPYIALNSGARFAKSCATFSSLPTLSSRPVDGGREHREGVLQGDACVGLVTRRNRRAIGLRRPADQSGRHGGAEKQGSVKPFLTNMAGSTPRDLAAEFGAFRRLRPNLSNVVGHLILSHDPTDRALTESEWKEAIQIALHTHGADEASFAAWRHDDSRHAHAHVIFSRVLTTNQVVSDSHNYRKNEAAARLIESKFMLNAPTPTPAEDRPGDRQAQTNAGRRAERRGTIDPTKISPQVVRDALFQADDFADFQQRLRAAGFEVEFDRRGKDREIFGWRLRRAGAEEWMKASSIHKDLSWPKIAHRFAEPVPAILAAQRPDLDRVPSQLQPILQLTDEAKQMVPLSLAANVTEESGISADLTKFSNDAAELYQPQTRWGALHLGLLRLAVECARLAADVAAALINFVKNLLRLFGFGLHAVRVAPSLQNIQSEAPPPALTFEPVLLSDEPKPLPAEDRADMAADSIQHVLDVVRDGRTDDLPMDVEGRAELVAALEASASGAAAGAAAGQAPADLDSVRPSVAAASMAQLAAATAAHKAARTRVDEARKRESAQVAAARDAHFDARMSLQEAKAEHAFERRNARIKFLHPPLEKVAASQLAAMAAAEKGLAAALIKFPPVVAPELYALVRASQKNVEDSAESVYSEVMMAIERMGLTARKDVKNAAANFESAIRQFRSMPDFHFAGEVQKTADAAEVAINNSVEAALKDQAARLRSMRMADVVGLPADADEEEPVEGDQKPPKS